jgi:ATP-dependent helicase HrpB
MQPLPIDPFLPALVAALRAKPGLVLVAEPGAGKTTRVPRALLDAGFAADGEIVVLEPRRIAARMAARRVAEELGEALGKRVGYQVRLEEVASAETRVRFVTEGVLTRRLVADRELRGVAAVVLDELHERHLQGDLALALLRKLQRERRPDLRLIAMSATLDAEPVARLLDAEILRVPGRVFEVAIEHETQRDERRLEAKVAAAVRRLLDSGLDGDVLVFLPGAAEIRRAREALEPLAKQAGLELALLHGDLPPEEQDRAVRPGRQRKVILSTNVAESSLTIEGVSAVIDSGLARMAGHSPWSGLPTLETAKISRASATQRAGRAGRLRAGRCLRLYDKHDHDGRPAHDKPEIARADLADTLLAVKASAGKLEIGDWLDAPPAQAWGAAGVLCERLGALDAGGELSELGRRMLRLPLHPRLSRVLLEAAERGASERGALLAALLSERDIVLGARARFDDRARDVESGPSDALDRLGRFEEAEAAGLDGGTLRRHELDAGAVHAVKRTRDRLLRALPRSRASGPAFDDDEPLLLALLAGFGDRVAKRRSKGGSELVLAGGGSVSQSPGSVMKDAELCVVLDAQQGPRGVVAHLLSAIEPEHLLELFPERVLDRTSVRFDAQAERVLALQELTYEGLVLDSSRVADPSGPEVERALFEAAASRGVQAFDDVEAIEGFVQRWAHASRLDARVPAPPESAGLAALRAACEGRRSFAELRTTGVIASLRALCAPSAAALLERLCPEQVELGSGRRLRVHYEPDRPPWIESRLQDFFGLRQGPRLGDQPLVLHLLAPNQRAVQVTTDLAGFWQRHYPELRRQLMRRYPRHSWPEDPLNASPPAPKR